MEHTFVEKLDVFEEGRGIVILHDKTSSSSGWPPIFKATLSCNHSRNLFPSLMKGKIVQGSMAIFKLAR